MRTGLFFGAAIVVISACGGVPGATQTGVNPSTLVPRLFDPTALYHEMGMLAAGGAVPFVASMHFLAGPEPDSTVAVFALSLANDALSFRRQSGNFVAKYRVAVTFARADTMVGRITREEVVRVGSYQETLRADESVIFQEFVVLSPDVTSIRVVVRDVHGDQTSQDEREFEVPRLNRGLSTAVPVYRGSGRRSARDIPVLLVNPRSSVPFGRDSLMFYIEGYGDASTGRVSVRVSAANGDSVWSSDAELTHHGAVGSAQIDLGTARLPVGVVRVEVVHVETGDTAVAPALVSFSEQWTITNFEEVLSLLRYFGHDSMIDAMRDAPVEERPDAWRAFWRASDPNPVTPRNEALEDYFRRVQTANVRFRETGDAGWLTDRGEVFISLGDPDEVFDQRSEFQGQRRVIRWIYVSERLTLDFVDETGFGRFRLSPSSRADFYRVRERVREDGFR